MKRYYCDVEYLEAKAGSHVVVGNDDRKLSVIWLNGLDLFVLLHELSHAVINILDQLDIAFDIDNQETFCYLLQDLYEKAIDACKLDM